MAVITTGSHPKALWPGVYEWWGLKYNEHPVEWTDLFDTHSSEKNYEEVVQSTGFPLAPVKNQGESVTYAATHKQGFTTRFTHVTYALGYIVTWEEIQDNLYMEISKRRSGANAFSMRQTKETVAAQFYNRAFNAAFPMADGVSVINSAHTLIGGGTFSNLASGDLSEAALEDICIQIYGATNDEGLRISLMPRSLNIPRQLWFKANRILKSVLQNDTANNAVNVLKLVNAFPEGIKMNHFLTDPDAWFVRTNVSEGGLIHFKRHPIEFVQDNDFDTKNAKAFSIERYSFGIADPRALYGSPGL